MKILLIIFLLLTLILFYITINSTEYFTPVENKPNVSNFPCDFLNYNEINMISVELKNGYRYIYDRGINIVNIDMKYIKNIDIKGYAGISITINVSETPNMFVIKYFTNIDKYRRPIDIKELPDGTIVKIVATCRSPINGGWTDWITTKQCYLDVDGYFYVDKMRYCTYPPPMFNGEKCSGQNRIKVDCQLNVEDEAS